MKFKKYSKLFGIGLVGMSTQFATPHVSNSQELCPKGFQLVMSGDRNGVSEKCVRIAELAERDPEWYMENEELRYSKVHYKIEKVPIPAKGINFSYNVANLIVDSWTETELDSTIAELKTIPNSIRQTIKGMLKYWPLIKFHADQIGKSSKKILDPREVAHIMLAENAGYASMRTNNPVRGAAGEGTLMQIIPTTAKLMYDIYSRHYKYYEKDKPHYLGINGLINGMFFALDGKSALGIEKLHYNEISPENLAKLYDFYNKANIKDRIIPTWQIENFAESSKYMFLYDFLEKQTLIKLEKIQLASKKQAETKVSNINSADAPEKVNVQELKVETANIQNSKPVLTIHASKKDILKNENTEVKSETILKKPADKAVSNKNVFAEQVQTEGLSNLKTNEVKKTKDSINVKNDLTALREKIDSIIVEISELKKKMD